MPDELLERIDEFAENYGYTGHSEVVREAARNLLGEFEDRRLGDRDPMGVVTVRFNYETTSVEERMTHPRHEHEALVASDVHSHVGDAYCMELFILEGALADIPTFVGKSARHGTSSPSTTRSSQPTGSTPRPPTPDRQASPVSTEPSMVTNP